MKVTIKIDAENVNKIKAIRNKPIRITDGEILARYFGEDVVELEIEIIEEAVR